MATGRKIGYVRVSSVNQKTERQLDGVAVDRTFTDNCSGKDTERPQLTLMLGNLRDGDTLLVHPMDRDVGDLRRIVEGLTARGVVVQFIKESLTFSDEASPMNLLLLNMLGVVAQFERAMILERQREGIAVAKLRGVYKGRNPVMDAASIALALAFIKDGVPKTVIARELGVSRASLYAHLKQQSRRANAKSIRR